MIKNVAGFHSLELSLTGRAMWGSESFLQDFGMSERQKAGWSVVGSEFAEILRRTDALKAVVGGNARTCVGVLR